GRGLDLIQSAQIQLRAVSLDRTEDDGASVGRKGDGCSSRPTDIPGRGNVEENARDSGDGALVARTTARQACEATGRERTDNQAGQRGGNDRDAHDAAPGARD